MSNFYFLGSKNNDLSFFLCSIIEHYSTFILWYIQCTYSMNLQDYTHVVIWWCRVVCHLHGYGKKCLPYFEQRGACLCWIEEAQELTLEECHMWLLFTQIHNNLLTKTSPDLINIIQINLSWCQNIPTTLLVCLAWQSVKAAGSRPKVLNSVAGLGTLWDP